MEETVWKKRRRVCKRGNEISEIPLKRVTTAALFVLATLRCAFSPTRISSGEGRNCSQSSHIALNIPNIQAAITATISLFLKSGDELEYTKWFIVRAIKSTPLRAANARYVFRVGKQSVNVSILNISRALVAEKK